MTENQRTVTISADSWSNGEKVLEAIAKGEATSKYFRAFGDWHIGESGLKECRGEVGVVGKASVRVILTVGRKGDIPLENIPGSRWYPSENGCGFVVRIGKTVPDRLIANIANQLVSWVARGDDSNRRPYGKSPAPKSGVASLAGTHRRRRRYPGLAFVH